MIRPTARTDVNRSAILAHLGAQGPASRAELARALEARPARPAPQRPSPALACGGAAAAADAPTDAACAAPGAEKPPPGAKPPAAPAEAPATKAPKPAAPPPHPARSAASRPTFAHRTRRHSAGAPPARRRFMSRISRSRPRFAP